jgi:hypothetical protein
MFGIVDPGTTYTLAVILGKCKNLPEERKVDLILQSSTYCGTATEEYMCMQHFKYGNTVHNVTLKVVCALQGETISEVSLFN